MASGQPPAQSTHGSSTGRRLVNDVCLSLLVMEATNYLLGRRGNTAPPGQPQRTIVGEGGDDLGADNFREVHHAAVVRLEGMGYDVGCRLTERLCQAKLLTGEPLECVKFICKDFWTEVFKKQIDKLQTDHRGTFVLRDLSFKWLAAFAPDKSRSDRNLAWFTLQFACGLIRGAMVTLGQPAAVKADFWDEKTDKSQLPAVSFTVRLKSG